MTNRTPSNVVNVALSATLLCLSGTVFAQTRDRPEVEAAGVQVGETNLFPLVRFDYQSYNNVYQDGFLPQDATAVSVQPAVSWLADRRLLGLRAEYNGEYSNGSEDILTFDNHRLEFAVNANPTKRVDLRSSLTLTQENESLDFNELGLADSDVSLGLLKQNNIYWLSTMRYGSASARGNLRFGLNIRQFDPGNRRNLFLKSRNQFTSVQPFASFSLRVSPDTRATVRVSTNSYTYDNLSNNDLQVNSVFVGLNFSETGVVGGNAQVGLSDLQFEDSSVDNSILAIEVDLFYKPTSFSEFYLTVDRSFDERTAGINNNELESNEVLTGQLEWVYDYSDRLAHRARIFIEDTDRSCEGIGETEVGGGLEIDWRVRRWFKIGAGVETSQRTIDDCGLEDVDTDALEYDAQIFNVFATFTL